MQNEKQFTLEDIKNVLSPIIDNEELNEILKDFNNYNRNEKVEKTLDNVRIDKESVGIVDVINHRYNSKVMNDIEKASEKYKFSENEKIDLYYKHMIALQQLQNTEDLRRGLQITPSYYRAPTNMEL